MLGEAEDRKRRTAVVEEAEVFALEAGDELTVLVDDGEDEIDFVDLDLKGGDGLVDLWGVRGLWGVWGGSLAGRGGSLGGSLRRRRGGLLSGGGGWSGADWRRWGRWCGRRAGGGLGYFGGGWRAGVAGRGEEAMQPTRPLGQSGLGLERRRGDGQEEQGR